MGIFALLINPKNGEPFYAEKEKSRTVTIYPLDDADNGGSGYFNDSLGDSYGQASRVTGLPRVHTPGGVAEKGKGLGTVLYTALCAAAHLEFEGDLSLPGIDVSGNGISSNAERSAYADAWWSRAKGVYGLAHTVTSEVEQEKDFDIDTSDRDYRSEVAEIVANYVGIEYGSRVTVHRFNVSASGTYRGEEEEEADAYPYGYAERANLVIGFLKQKSFTRWTQVGIGHIEVVSKKALAAVNMGVLREYDGDDGARIANQLINLAQHEGLPAHVIDGMRLRFVLGADVSPATWEHPNFETYSPVRSNPRRNVGKKSQRLGQTQILVPRTVPAARVGFYRPKRAGGVRSNPSGASPAIQAEVQRLHELRVQLGWSVFAADPASPARTKARRKPR